MKTNIKNIIKKAILPASIVAAAASPYQSDASDIFIGRRGPTPFQADIRRTAVQTEKGKQAMYDGIAKVWTGNGLGFFGFLRGQYKQVSSANGENAGWNSYLAGVGPRGRFKNLHLLSYVGFKKSLADRNAKIPLDSGSFDERFGLFATQMIGNYDVDASAEYNKTGKNTAGINPADELSFGLVGGRGIDKKARVAAGLTGLVKEDGDYLVNLRGVLRYTFCPAVHAELLIDEGVYGGNLPGGLSFTALVRYNPFVKK